MLRVLASALKEKEVIDEDELKQILRRHGVQIGKEQGSSDDQPEGDVPDAAVPAGADPAETQSPEPTSGKTDSGA